jgi:hypothetical protein
MGAIDTTSPTAGYAGTAANLGNSARAASPIPGVNDGAAAPSSGKPHALRKQGGGQLDVMKHQGRGLLRVLTNDELDAAEKRSVDLSEVDHEVATDLANYIRQRFEKAVRHRRVIAVDDELIRDMRAYNGQYDPGTLQAIQSMNGSTVYSRLMTMKCRGATALLRNVYMNSDRPWTLYPTSDPHVPDSIENNIAGLVHSEVMSSNQNGQIVPQEQIRDRLLELYEAAKLAERRKAAEDAKHAQMKVDKILEDGRFYVALSEFLADLPVYKYAVLKGPVTRKHTSLKWKRGTRKLEAHEEARFFWERVSPWDIWFSPGATAIVNTEVFERQRMSVNDLYNLIGLPGYREDDIRAIIQAYEGRGFKEWIQIFDYERAQMEGRNNILDDTYINAIEFHGFILGRYLQEYKVPGVDDPLKPYFVTAWMVDKRVFKVMLNPSPRLRVPYYVTSFDKQPGSLFGNGIPALANDLTDVINATLRALVNNIAISSGPQVVYDEEMFSPSQDDSLYPWKRWKYTGDPSRPNAVPVTFFQPQSNAMELMQIIDKFSVMLDDVSTIPRYLTGSGQAGGAGRTASGLSMLINNANKTLQNVADNIDTDVFQPLLEMLYDFIMLTDTTGILRGDEEIVVEGVRQAAKQEQDLTKQLQFLQLINNPAYQGLMGPDETARVLQQIADNIGMEIKIKQPGDNPIPPGQLPGLPPAVITPPGWPASAALPPPPSQPGLPGGPAGMAGAGFNPSGSNAPAPSGAAPPGAGGVQGIPAAPQGFAPLNTVQPQALPGV